MRNDIFVHLLKTGQPEVVTENDDGSYSIFIDPALDYETQFSKYVHAVKHINRHDFSRDITADQAERRTHEIN